MNCKNLKKRQRKYKTFIYCNKLKKEIYFDNCRNCEYKEYKEYKPMKQKTTKQAKAERNRFSLFTSNLDHCILCGRDKDHLHEVFFGSNRLISIKYGLVIPVCHKCHSMIHKSSELQNIWHIRGQKKFEEVYPELDFLEIFGRNYKK